MTYWLTHGLMVGVIAVSTFSTVTSAQTPSSPFKDLLPQAQLLGQSRLTVWGFKIYDAQLWAAPGFQANRYASQPLALELAYLRDFDAVDIAERSLKEMRRSATISDAQARQWRLDMQRVFPDVKAGDRILGMHRPGIGASFWVNGKAGGEILDAEFSKLFFGIWLSPQTSEPAMRTALVGGAGS
ncbi:MAG: chalcone isomerase family protein [Polaromonas sp.]|nr:chalcone isomerase family protein [Polaromonas sp.]